MTFPVSGFADFDPATGEVTATFRFTLPVTQPPPVEPPQPPPVEPVLTLDVEPGVGRAVLRWSCTAPVASFRVDRNRPAGATVSAWGTDLPGDATSQEFTRLDPVTYTFTVKATCADGRVVTESISSTCLPPAPPPPPPPVLTVHTPWLPFDRRSELPADRPTVLVHCMPTYLQSDDDESYQLRIGPTVATKTALPTGLKMADAGHSRRVAADDRLWTWTGTAWVDQGVCPAYRTVGAVVDNPKDYWTSANTPPGSSAETQAFGGPTRNRPLHVPRVGGTVREFRTVLSLSNIRQAVGHGANVVTVHLPQIGETSIHWPRAMDYVRATEKAQGEGLKVHCALMPDSTTSATMSVKKADGSVDVDASAAALVRALLSTCKSPAHWRVDGKLVLMPYAPDLGPDRLRFWTLVKRGMAAAGEPCYFLATFLTTWDKLASAGWDAIVDEYSEWGARTVSSAIGDHVRNRTAVWNARTRFHKGFTLCVARCDYRPRQGRGWESLGMTTLDENWATAKGKHSGSRPEKATRVHLITWDDFPEGSELAPSVQSGHAVMDYCAWDLEAYLTGQEPVAKRDGLYLTQRVQFWKDPANPMTFTGKARAGQLEPVYKQTKFIEPVASTPSNTSDWRIFAPGGPATLEIEVDGVVVQTKSVPAGRSSLTLPLYKGMTVGRLLRDGQPVATVKTREPVVTTAPVQDLQPRTYSSYRQALGEQ